MAQGKKISELTEVSSVTDNDEFLFVDKEGSGANSGVGGQTAKIKFSDLKSAVGAGTTGAKGASGDKGMKGESGPRGLDGAGTQYWTQSPSDGDAVYYDAGNIGIGTDSPIAPLHVVGNSAFNDPDGAGSQVVIGHPGIGNDTVSANIRMFDSKGEKQMELLGGGKYTFMNGNVGIGTDSPTHNLHLSGDAQVKLKIESTGGNPEIQFTNPNADDATAQSSWMVGQSATNSFFVTKHGLGSGYQFTINNAGNVGIGPLGASSNAGDMLHISTSELQCGLTLHAETKQAKLVANSAGSLALKAGNGGNATEANMSFEVNGAEAMRITNAGNVGIGTDSPTSMLDIQTDGTDALPVKVQSMHPNQTGLRLTNGAGDTASTWTMMSRSYVDPLAPSSLTFQHGAVTPSEENQTLVLTPTGNVGIGTTNPTYAKLVVRGGGGYDDITSQPMKTQLEVFTSDEATAIQSIQRDNNNASSDIHFWGNDFIFRSVNGTGNVGIGTESPKAMLSIRGNNSGDKARVSFLGDGNGAIGSVRGEVVAKIATDPVNNPGSNINTKGDLTFHTNSYSQVAGGTYSDDVEKEAFRLTTDGGMVHTASGFYRSRAARFFNTTNDNTKRDRDIKFYVGADMNYRIKITIDGLAPYNYNGTAFFKEYEIVGQTETTDGMHYGHLLEHRELQASNLHTGDKPDFYELNYNRVQDPDGTWAFWISVKVRFFGTYVANARVEGYMSKSTHPNQQNRTIIHGSSQVDTLDGFGIVPVVEDGTDNVQSPEELQYPTTKSTDK